MKTTPAYLGKQVASSTGKLDLITWHGGPVTVTLDCSEFTSHCPVTKQPDFGTLHITYTPDKSLVETKSLKLFLWSYRKAAKFNEVIVAELAEKFFAQIEPLSVTVVGKFYPRGGISVTAEKTITRPQS